MPLDDPYEIEQQLSKRIDVFIDSGLGTLSTTSIINLSWKHPKIIHRCVGDVNAFEKTIHITTTNQKDML